MDYPTCLLKMQTIEVHPKIQKDSTWINFNSLFSILLFGALCGFSCYSSVPDSSASSSSICYSLLHMVVSNIRAVNIYIGTTLLVFSHASIIPAYIQYNN